jgi:hypothetical protein
MIEEAKLLQQTKSYFNGITTDQFLKRSKSLVEALTLQQSVKPVHKNDISEEYLDYDKYSRNYVKLRNAPLSDQDAQEEFSLGKNIQSFIEKLDASIEQKKIMMEHIQEIKNDAQTRGLSNDNTAALVSKYYKMLLDGPKEENDPGRRDINLGDIDDRRFRDFKVWGRVSIFAKEEIYKLHLEGWSIRNLSLRFGLLPERIKFIIWARQYFYEEVIPNVDLRTIRLGIEREMLYGHFFPFVDYGLDLVELSKREQGVSFHRYRWGELDANPPKEVQQKLEAIESKQTKKKYDIVTENFVGEGNRGYFVKSWIVYKNQGNSTVNKKFRAVVHHSHSNPQLLPDKVRSKLNKGPRIASKGYGFN